LGQGAQRLALDLPQRVVASYLQGPAGGVDGDGRLAEAALSRRRSRVSQGCDVRQAPLLSTPQGGVEMP